MSTPIAPSEPDVTSRLLASSPPRLDSFPSPRRPAAPPPRPFAARIQSLLIIVMFLGLGFIAQQRNKDLYQFGLPLLIVAAFLQIAFGNIPPATGARKSLLLFLVSWLIVAAVFALGIFLAPTLIDLTRGDAPNR